MRAYGISERGLLVKLLNQSLREGLIRAEVVQLRWRHSKRVMSLQVLIHLMADLLDRAFEKILIVHKKAQGS
jgi:hypothetical protein